MTHIDIFSGIAGFAYAAREIWGEEARVMSETEPKNEKT